MVNQGDIVKCDGIEFPFVVVSNNIYNKSGSVLVCPIVKKNMSVLSFPINSQSIKGYAQCDNLRMINLKKRDYIIKGSVSIAELLNIIDMIAAITDIV